MKKLNVGKAGVASVVAVGGILFCGSVCAEEPVGEAAAPAAAEEEETPEGWRYELGEGVSFGEQSIVSGEFELAFDSKYLTYGCVDNNDPVLRPKAGVTFFDWVQFKMEAIYDVTKYGRKCGWDNREWKMEEYDPSVRLAHEFTPEDFEWLPTKVALELAYMYEYHPRAMGGDANGWGDTQFVWLEASMEDLWLEPYFYYERDIDRDNGTYVNLELGHTFALVDGAGEDDDPVLAFRPSVAQGLGNTQRTRGYDLADDHGGLMDLCIKGELTWNIGGGVAVSGYVAYYDYVFDSTLREGARAYEARGMDDTSYHFVGGLALSATF